MLERGALFVIDAVLPVFYGLPGLSRLSLRIPTFDPIPT